MPHYRLDYTLRGTAVLSGDEEEIESVIKDLEDGSFTQDWVRRLLFNGVNEVELDDAQLTDDELQPEEELNFEKDL